MPCSGDCRPVADNGGQSPLRGAHASTTATHEVPSASATTVGALITSELVDQNAGITVVVRGAAAATARAARVGGRAVGLRGVLKGTSLSGAE